MLSLKGQSMNFLLRTNLGTFRKIPDTFRKNPGTLANCQGRVSLVQASMTYRPLLVTLPQDSSTIGSRKYIQQRDNKTDILLITIYCDYLQEWKERNE